jgi:hypothetical protein
MKYRKKPIVIEAFQMTKEVYFNRVKWPQWLIDKYEDSVFYGNSPFGICGELFISTLEGKLYVSFNDWIIRGVKGELYPCKPDIFEATYESVS